MYKVVYKSTESQNHSLPMTEKELFKFIKALFQIYEIESFYVEKVDKP